MKTCIYDLTRFLQRSHTATPDGIGRVDIAYIKEILGRGSAQTLFVASGNGVSREVPFDVVKTLARLREESWQSGDLGALHEFRDKWLAPQAYARQIDLPAIFAAIVTKDERKRERLLLHLFDLLPRPTMVRKILIPRVRKMAAGLAKELEDIGPNSRSTRRLAVMALARSQRACAAMAREAAAAEWSAESGIDDALLRKIKERGLNNCIYVNINQALAWNSGILAPYISLEGMSLAVMIHDVIPFVEGEHIKLLPQAVVAKGLAHLHAGGTTFIMNSLATEAEFNAFAAKCGLTDLRIVAAPLGIDSILADAPDTATPDEAPYFVAIGTLQPRKNYMLLLRIWKRLKEEMGESAPRLVLIGAKGWRTEELLPAITQIDAADLIDHHLNMNDQEMRKVLRGARAMLFPTFSEGWGFPVVEAITEGVPLICSDIAALREAGQSVPDYIDPLDGPAWQRAIKAYIDVDGQARRFQMVRRSSFVPITWSDHFHRIGPVLFNQPDTRSHVIDESKTL